MASISLSQMKAQWRAGEFGIGRMAEPHEIVAVLDTDTHWKPLAGKRALVTGRSA